MDKKLINKILTEHKKIINNNDVGNPKIAICFSGTPASGKTFLAKKIEKEFNGIRLNNDELRIILSNFTNEYNFSRKDLMIWEKVFETSNIEKINKKHGFTENELKIESLLREYMGCLQKKYMFRNGLLIFDSSFDRTYKITFPILEESGFKIFVIRMPFSKKLFITREEERNGDMDFFIKNIDRWKKDYDNFNADIDPDFIFNDNIEELMDAIRKIIISK